MHLFFTIIAATVVTLGNDANAFGNEPPSCGPAALVVSARLLGRELSPETLRAAMAGRVIGTHSFGEIRSAARTLGLASRPVHLDTRSPDVRLLPLIIPLRGVGPSHDSCHFVVLYGRRDGQIQVLDPPGVPYFISVPELVQWWDGTGLYVAGAEEQLDKQLGAACTRESAVMAVAGIVVVAGGISVFCAPANDPRNPHLDSGPGFEADYPRTGPPGR